MLGDGAEMEDCILIPTSKRLNNERYKGDSIYLAGAEVFAKFMGFHGGDGSAAGLVELRERRLTQWRGDGYVKRSFSSSPVLEKDVTGAGLRVRGNAYFFSVPVGSPVERGQHAWLSRRWHRV